ncbi:MAG: hypothetical protein ACR2GA_02890 [Chloroflexota bacterium]
MSVDQPALCEDLMSSPRSRAQFLIGAGALATTLGLAPEVVSAQHLRGGGVGHAMGMGESPQTILNIAATAEAAAVTALYHVHVAVLQGKVDTSGVAVPVATLVAIVRAILREEQDHYAFITGAGGKPLLTSFSFPPAIFRSALASLAFLEAADTIFTAAYMAANREFAAAGAATLAQYTYQIGGTECEHRALARAGQGKLPNNKSYETNLYQNVAGAAYSLKALGILKPNMPYPGARAVDHILGTTVSKNVSAGVIQRHP